MCDCSICNAEKEIRLCKNIANFLQNLPFQLAKFRILDAKFEIFFLQKNAGTDRSQNYKKYFFINNISRICKYQPMQI